tara:strand:+ start:375 stop:572 length:198 start_codon:yes stop_codon:yes gene_type:complete
VLVNKEKMDKIWYAIADFFQFIFRYIEMLGNSVNYLYVVIIFVFLVVWTLQMLKHRKNNEEHASS